jgi:uncharacterized protein YndB with AHSA1/START domain
MAKSKSGSSTRPGDEAVRNATGKEWAQWFRILDAKRAMRLDHKGIVAILAKAHGVGPWWQQMITVAYEQERGLRKVHEMSDGFQISRSKTVIAPAARAFAAWKNSKGRAEWLADPDLTIRKATANKRLRITWGDKRINVEVYFLAKGARKTQVTVVHSKLPDERAAARMKEYWASNLEALRAHVEK